MSFSWSISWPPEGLGLPFCVLTLFTWLIVTIAARGQGRAFHLTALFVMPATLGVFLAVDWFTFFTCFELMSLGASLWVFQGGEAGRKAGKTYLLFAVPGGFAMLLGLVLLYRQFGTLDMQTLALLCGEAKPPFPACVFLLLGLGIKAGAVPLHLWLPGTYQAAPAPAAALFSAVLSKTGIYGLLLISLTLLPSEEAWMKLLCVLGLVTMVLGGLCALRQARVRAVLAYSSLSQMGMLLMGVAVAVLPGEMGLLAAWGVLLHMLTHGISKTVLFLFAGHLESAGETRLSRLAGAGRGNPWLYAAFLLASLSLCGAPLLGGYLSKTLLHEGLLLAAGEFGGVFLPLCEKAFLLAGGLTLAYLLRLWRVLFWKRGEGEPASRSLRVLLPVTALPLLILGTATHWTDAMLAWSLSALPHSTAYFNWHNLQGILLSWLVGLALFAGLCLWERRQVNKTPQQRKSLAWLQSVPETIFRLGEQLALILSGGVETLVALLKRWFFDGSWDREEPSRRDGDFGRYDKPAFNPGKQSLSHSMLLFVLGLCFMIAAVCFSQL